MGPIKDTVGVKQGGTNSGDYYKLYNNDLLITAQKSQQGIDLGGDLVVSAVGLADDTVLAANSLACLSNILHLALDYCKKYRVSLCPSKTKLIKIHKNTDTNDLELFNPIKIGDNFIEFSSTAEHVGTLRSNDGNLPNIMNRIVSHRKALGGVLFTGIARKQRANPVVGLKVEKLYASPVLMSGLGSLVLTESELSVIDAHVKETTQNLQKLFPKTPRSVIFFLGGCLPGIALHYTTMH